MGTLNFWHTKLHKGLLYLPVSFTFIMLIILYVILVKVNVVSVWCWKHLLDLWWVLLLLLNCWKVWLCRVLGLLHSFLLYIFLWKLCGALTVWTFDDVFIHKVMISWLFSCLDLMVTFNKHIHLIIGPCLIDLIYELSMFWRTPSKGTSSEDLQILCIPWSWNCIIMLLINNQRTLSPSFTDITHLFRMSMLLIWRAFIN